MSERDGAAVPLRRLRRSTVIAAAIEVPFYVAIVVALFQREWLLAALLIVAKASIWHDALLTPQVSYLVLAGALFVAYRRGASAVFFLTAPVAIGHIAGMLRGLQRGAGMTAWERYFAGVAPVARWASIAHSWRRRGPLAHRAAWTAAVAIGVGWTLALLWAVIELDSVWSWPYAAVLIWFSLWWCYLLLRAVWRRLPLSEPARSRPDEASSPPEWHVQILRTGAPTDLDLRAAFTDGQADSGLRLFAADCAEHALASPTEVGREPHGAVMACIDCARERAAGTRRGWSLNLAFDNAYGNIRESSRRLREAGAEDDTDALHRFDDATMAAYHALCAPTPMDAARYASNATAITWDGEARGDERGWQIERLDFYRREAVDR